MKKIGLICVTLLAGLSLSACNNLASQSHKASSSSSSTKVVKNTIRRLKAKPTAKAKLGLHQPAMYKMPIKILPVNRIMLQLLRKAMIPGPMLIKL